jgi:hypothetical protein
LGLPASVGRLVQAPAEQVPVAQSWHALPPVPQAAAALPVWQVRVASQQPEHVDGPHEGPVSAVEPSPVAPSSPAEASLPGAPSTAAPSLPGPASLAAPSLPGPPSVVVPSSPPSLADPSSLVADPSSPPPVPEEDVVASSPPELEPPELPERL